MGLMIYSTRTEDEASVFVVCRNCAHLFQNMQVIIDFLQIMGFLLYTYYKFISVFNTMTCPGSPARPWISPLHCFWHCHYHWKMCQLRGRYTKKKERKKRTLLITGGFQGNHISQTSATSVTKSRNAVSSDCMTTIRDVRISWIHFLCTLARTSVKSQVDMRSIVIQLDLRELS